MNTNTRYYLLKFLLPILFSAICNLYKEENTIIAIILLLLVFQTNFQSVYQLSKQVRPRNPGAHFPSGQIPVSLSHGSVSQLLEQAMQP